VLDPHSCPTRKHVDHSRSVKEELSHVFFFLHLHDIPILYIWKNPSNERLVDTYYSKVELWCIKSLYSTSVTSLSYESLIYICYQRLSLLQL
jgi:hypothetical protein